MNQSVNKKALLVRLGIFYLILRFVFSQELDAFNAYATYGLEVLFIFFVSLIVGRESIQSLKLIKRVWPVSAMALVSGFLFYKGAGALSVPIPFDFECLETLLFLLIVAPVLEELVFRFFLWRAIESYLPSVVALLLTSALFSYAHFHAYWSTPEFVHSFIYYQSAYTFFLALGCGWFVMKHRSVGSAILIHFAFNLGFYLASL